MDTVCCAMWDVGKGKVTVKVHSGMSVDFTVCCFLISVGNVFPGSFKSCFIITIHFFLITKELFYV